nr:protein AUXIN RESPONSE 4 [Ipomoea batatas]
MAIITEEPDPPTPPPKRRTSPPPKPLTPPPPSTRTSPTTKNTANPFQFWFYFTVLVSLVTLFFIFLSSFSPKDPKAWFLSLPPNLRRHYSNGRTIKVQTAPNHPQVEVFSIQEGPIKSPDHVLIVHGLGCSTFAFQKIVKSLGQKGVHAVAIDLPGSGFSDKSVVVEEESGDGGGVVSLWDVYNEIREKGLFWGFDQLVEKGYVNYEENEVPKRKRVKAIELDPEEMGRVLGQVIEAMGLAPVDLVLHDSALSLSANWVSENPGILRSVTILDSEPSATALPLWALGVPVIREAVLHSGFLFKRLLEKYCCESVSKSDAEAHRILLAGRDGRRAVVGMGKRLNYSLDLAEWSASDGVKALPMQVIWSTGLSKEWSENGQRVAASLPRAKFVTHSGGRWPQEHSADEIAESIYHFVSPLPKSIKQSEEEQVPEHIQKMLNEAQNSGHDHHHHHHGHGHEHHDGHGHGNAHAGYMDAYGLGHGWGM